MLVYVLNKDGLPLMPCSPSKARKLLKEGKAKIVNRLPFTIELKYGSSGYKQNINLGVDAGSKYIGISATTEKKVLFEGQVENRKDVVELISSRREVRRTRRNRLRYRKPRFQNRKVKEGKLASSIIQKIQTHESIIHLVHKILPISKIIVETASFDIQKLKNPDIEGKEYQEGEQKGFWNIREYILFRDNHECQYCKGKSKDKILNVHHLESRKTGGNSPSNLITLCKTCHEKYHKGEIKLDKVRGKSYKDSTFMGIMRKTLLKRLRNKYKNVEETFGYITKSTRIENKLEKSHINDARCISRNSLALNKENQNFIFKKVRRHNRKIYKDKFLKGGKKRKNTGRYERYGFHRFDLVKYEGRIKYINTLRESGSFQIKDLNDEKYDKQASYKKLTKIKNRSGFVLGIK